MKKNPKTPNNVVHEGAADRRQSLWREQTLERLHGMATSLDNPVYIWEAIGLCNIAGFPPIPLPEWCISYLVSISCGISMLANLRDPSTYPIKSRTENDQIYGDRVAEWMKKTKRLTATEAKARLPAVLGFTKPNGASALSEAYKNRAAKHIATLATVPKGSWGLASTTSPAGQRLRSEQRKLAAGRKLLARNGVSKATIE